MNLTTDQMYDVILEKDTTFEGLFFTCVKTTGIFCRPTCSARKPKRENVSFTNTVKEAMDLGYRPCKVCKPLNLKDETPDWIAELLKELGDNPTLKLKDYDLTQRGMHPNRVRRWFQKNHGMSFQAYQRSLRISSAFGTIKHGENPVTSTAYSHGYDSLSGFGEAFKKSTGFSPKDSQKHQVIYVTRILTPLGPMLAACVDDKLCMLEFTDRKMLETELSTLNKLLKANFLPGHHPLFDQLSQELKEYFEGERTDFDIPLITPGTEFQNSVWRVLLEIPYGETRSYADQAIKLGNLKAIRAVATANGYNRISIIVPCHRVIGKDGSLVGYGGGLNRKKFLLQLEAKHKVDPGRLF